MIDSTRDVSQLVRTDFRSSRSKVFGPFIFSVIETLTNGTAYMMSINLHFWVLQFVWIAR
jgi:hypothetical protein